MEARDGRYYMISALKRHYADRVATTCLIGPYCARFAGFAVKKILKDPKASAEAHLAFYRRFSPDSLIIYNDIYMEVEALGAELEFPEDDISRIKGPILAEKSRLARLRLPDPSRDGRIPDFLEVCDRVSSEVRKTATVGLAHNGPWNIAMNLRGHEQLLFDTVEDQQFVHELMRFTTEVVKTIGTALIEAGFSPSLGEASASCSLISPKIYTEFIKPYHKELCEYFKSRKAMMTMHICGYIDPIMGEIADTGIRFLSLDAPSSLRKLVGLSKGSMIIMGNVPTALFARGSRQEMEEAIRACIDTAAEGSGYILCSGCEIPLVSTEDRIEHFFSYGHAYGSQFMAALKQKRPELFH